MLRSLRYFAKIIEAVFYPFVEKLILNRIELHDHEELHDWWIVTIAEIAGQHEKTEEKSFEVIGFRRHHIENKN